MKYKFQVNGGGLFSRLLQCAIIPLSDVDFEKVYLTAYRLPTEDQVEPHVKPGIRIVEETYQLLTEHGVSDPWDSIFNFIIDQDHDDCLDMGLLPVGKFYSSKDPIESSLRLNDYRSVYSRLKIKKDILEKVPNLNQYGTVLGVHLRLKDGNSVETPVVFQDYVDAINSELRNYNYSKIFVAADNTLSIKKLEQLYPGMIISNQLARSDNELVDSFIWEYKNCFRKHYWVDPMIDCLTLSKCHSLICKDSNFSNAAIVFGDYKQIRRLF